MTFQNSKRQSDTSLFSTGETLEPYHTCQYTSSVNPMWFDYLSSLIHHVYMFKSYVPLFNLRDKHCDYQPNVRFIFPTGKICEECRDIWSQDLREYISEPWNLLDFSILAIFMTSFMARLMAFWHAYSAQCYVDKHYTNLTNMTLPFEIQYFQLGKCGP